MKKDNYNYVGWLQSDSILKRSFAVVGHNLLGVAIIYFGIFVGIFAIYFLIGVFDAL